MHHRRRSFVRVLSTLWLVALLGGCSAEDDPEARPSRAECEGYRDRIIALRLAEVTADRAQHEASLRRAFGTSFIERCMTSATRAEVRCAVDADDTKSLIACAR